MRDFSITSSRPHGRISATLLVLVAACDPGFTLKGQILDTAGKPVAGANVALNCEGHVRPTATSDKRGRFSAMALGWRPNTCVIEIDTRGAPPLRLLLGEHCAQPHGDDACLSAWIDLVVPSL
jgi:hypothetical protein